MPVSAKGCFPRENETSKFLQAQKITTAEKGKQTHAKCTHAFYTHNQGGSLLPFNYRPTAVATTIVFGKPNKKGEKLTESKERRQYYSTTNQATNQLTNQANKVAQRTHSHMTAAAGVSGIPSI